MGLDLFELLQQIGAQRIHLRAMRSEVDLDHPAEDVAGLKLFEDRCQRGRVARQYSGGRAGAHRDGDAIFVSGDRASRVFDG